VGRKPLGPFKTLGGAQQENRGAIKFDGEAPRFPSDKRSHDLFLTLETLRVEDDNFRFTFSKKAAFGSNKNASISSSFTLAWMRTL